LIKLYNKINAYPEQLEVPLEEYILTPTFYIVDEFTLQINH